MSRKIPYTCPIIDKAISSIRAAMQSAGQGQKIVEQNAGGDYFVEIQNDLYRLDDVLEEVRSANIELRQRGDELEAELERLQELTSQ